MNTKQLLDQDVMWRTRDGMPIALAHMSQEHRRNTLEFLRRNASFTRRAYEWCELNEDAQTYFREPRLDVSAPRSISPSDLIWLERTPMVAELMRLIRADGAIDTEAIMAEIGTSCHQAVEHAYTFDEVHEWDHTMETVRDRRMRVQPLAVHLVPDELRASYAEALRLHMNNAGGIYAVSTPADSAVARRLAAMRAASRALEIE